MNLNLENDERVIISTAGIRWMSDHGRMLEDFVLTSKGLYCIYKVKNGLFSKAEDEVYRFELKDILIEEGVSQIEQVKVNNERCLQIIFKHGAEHFSFQRVTKKTMEYWLDGFKEVLGVPDFTTVQRARNRERLGDLAGDVMNGVGTILENGSRMLFDKLEEMTENGRTSGGYKGTVENSKTTRSYRGSVRTEHTEETIEEPVAASAAGEDAVDTTVYYLAIDGQPKGPFLLEQVAELAIEGQINRNTLAWTKGMENWQPMETVAGLRSVTENMPPVLR